MRKFWFLIFLLSALSMTGQVYNVTKYSTDEGLVQSQVMCMVQDNRGYLWLGTHRGIDRFDGQKFKHFGIQEGLAGNFVADIIEDGERTFWIATDNGLSLFDGLKFKNFGSEEGFSENTIECLAMDPNGYLWLGTQSKGLMAFDREERMVKDLDLPGRLVNQGITALTWDSQDQLWIGTRSGLWMRDKRGDFHKVSHPKLPANLVIEEIFEGVQGQMLLGTTTGLYHYDGQTYHSYNPKSIGLDMRVFAVLQDRTGKVWIGTGNGLAWLEEGELTILDKSGRNLDIRVTSGLLDNEGNIWFGTDGGGVRKVTEGVFEAYTVQNEMSSNLAKSFLEDNEGRIWISTKDQGINVYEGRKKVRTYNQENGLGGNDICSSMEDSQGNFWFASYNGTLTKYRDGAFQIIDASDGLDCNSVYWVTEIGKDTLWIGTDNGLFIWENNRVTKHYTDADGLPTNIIYHILAESPSQIWLGTAMGLVEYAEGHFRLIEAPHAIGKNVLSILKDENGTLWIGSVKGLAAVQGDSTYFIKISGAPGAHTIVGLVMEADQYLWVATENGAYRLSVSGFDPLTRNSFEHYTQKDGLPSLECNANAAFTDKEGAVWLGTAEGAIHRPLNTERQRLRFPPKVYVTGIQNQEGLDWVNEGFKVDEGGLPLKLELPYSDNRLSFEYIGISLKSPKQVEYRFMLEGIDNDWLRPTRQREVFYPNLNPGKYTFKVVAKRETEPWNYDHPAEFSFEILSPFWKSWWFILILVSFVIGSGYTLYLTISTRRRQLREEQRIRNKAEKLQLEHQALYAMMNPHFTFNALQSIQNFIQRNDKKSAHKFLASFAKLVRKNLDSTQVDFISLSEELDRLKLYLALEKMRFPEKFDYGFDIDPELDLSSTQIPPMLLQPFVENSIKHGIMPLEKDGFINISIWEQDDDYLTVKIQDNGIGITASKNMRRNRPSDHVSKGMQITQDRLELFARMAKKSYRLDIEEIKDESDAVRGTEVHLVVPLHLGDLIFG